MKEACHIATGRIVRASEVDYPEYHGILQCPHCKVAMQLTKEYIRNGKIIIPAAFKHPEAETELQKKCPYRANSDSNTINSKPIFSESRGQCFKVLKKKFISKLKKHSKVSLTKYSSKNTLSLECVNIFISVICKLISLPNNGKFIQEQEVYIQEVIKAQTFKLDEKANSYFCKGQDLRKEKKEFIKINQDQIKKDIKEHISKQANLSSIRNHPVLENLCTSDKELLDLDRFISSFLNSCTLDSCTISSDKEYNSWWKEVYINYQTEILRINVKFISGVDIDNNYSDLEIKRRAVKWLLEFLCCDGKDMDKFRTDTLNYILGKYVDNEEIKLMCRDTNNQFLAILDQFLLDEKSVETFFKQKYSGNFSGKNAAIFQQIEKIHNLVFRLIIDYLLDFPWHQLRD
ncbi:hypothetical protein ACSQ6I_12645 [Anabaena sp. WFMT]|uniref:hypothetical protein n=1 Tax=Anabaena sp. WFMT TaxID=3449730 RepID=UPI003F1E6EB8